MSLTEQDIANALFQAGMGAESRLQQPGLARLGHPETGQIPADADIGIEGAVWCHAYGAPYALPGSEGDDRADDAGAPFVAILPLELRNIPLIPGQPVRTVREGSHVVITGTLPVEAHTYTGKEALQPAPQPVERWQLQYLTVRPNNPPDMGLTLVGGVVRVGDALRSIPNLPIGDLSSYLSGLTSGQAKALLIAVDTTDNSLVLTAGSAFTDNRDAGVSDHHALFANYPQTLGSEDVRALALVKLYRGMTEIVTEDLYPLLDPGDGGGGGSGGDAADITYTPADDTDWDGDADPGNVDDALDQLAQRVDDLEASSGGAVWSGCKVEYQPGSGWFEIDPADSWVVSFNLTALYDTHGYFNNAQPDRLTSPQDGFYELFAWMVAIPQDTPAVNGSVTMWIEAYFDEPTAGAPGSRSGGNKRYPVMAGDESDIFTDVTAKGNLSDASEPVVFLHIFNDTDVSIQIRFVEWSIEQRGPMRATPV